MSLTKNARNERAKLTASFLNGIGIACVAVGGLAPAVGRGKGTVSGGPVVYALMAGCIGTAGAYIFWEGSC